MSLVNLVPCNSTQNREKKNTKLDAVILCVAYAYHKEVYIEVHNEVPYVVSITYNVVMLLLML